MMLRYVPGKCYFYTYAYKWMESEIRGATREEDIIRFNSGPLAALMGPIPS
jgi:hypothetical protein